VEDKERDIKKLRARIEDTLRKQPNLTEKVAHFVASIKADDLD
jgi:hypothetical protein